MQKLPIGEQAPSRPNLPSLPAGYTAQPSGEFRDRSQQHLYEFYRVYGPTTRLLGGVLTTLDKLDQSLSYWAVTSSTYDAQQGERSALRWLSYEQACKQSKTQLTFEQFSQMDEALPALLLAPTGP